MEQCVEHRLDRVPLELTVEASTVPLSKVTKGESTKMSQKRASVRNTRASSRTSQLYQSQPTLENAQSLTNSVKDIESISPSTKSLSQTSTASRNQHSPSTTASSIRNGEEDVLILFDVPSPIKRNSVQIRQDSLDRNIIRGISVSSSEDLTRSSGRTRKPTTKAKALADEGTMFYKSLRQPSDNMDDVDTPKTDESATTAVLEPDMSSEVQPIAIEPEESIVASVESTPTRISPRQRKATAKAATTTEIDRLPRKRKTPPTNVNRASKSARISSAVPDKPSKLRHPILSAEEEQDTQNAKSAHKNPAVSQATVAYEAVADERHEVCSLKSCMEGQWRLLAFADFAADDISDEEENDDEFEALLTAAQDLNGPSSISEKIFKAHCVCRPSTSAKQLSDQNQDTTMLNADTSELPEDCIHEDNEEILILFEDDTQLGANNTIDSSSGKAKSQTLTEIGAQSASTDMSLQEAHAYFDSIPDRQKDFFRHKERMEDLYASDEIKAAYEDHDTGVIAEEVRYEITPKMKAARAVIVTQKRKEKEERIEMNQLILLRYNDHGDEYPATEADRETVFGRHRRALETDRNEFQKYQTMMEEKYSAPMASETQSSFKNASQVATTPKKQAAMKAKKRISNMKKSDAEKINLKAARTNGVTKHDPLGTSSLSAPSTDGLEKSKSASVEARVELASKTAGVESRESRRQSAPTQRMKILAANSTPKCSKVNKRDSAGTRRTRGQRSMSPTLQTATVNAQEQMSTASGQETRPSKKIILKFRRPDLLV